jgi:predicted nucleotidyltransferase
MDSIGLSGYELDLMRGVFQRHPEIDQAILFGSRAKGTGTYSSDVDLAVTGVDDPLKAESIARELDELPLPYRFDVKALAAIAHVPLREHIKRMGRILYQRSSQPLPWKVAERDTP